jgi:hypothetical protein
LDEDGVEKQYKFSIQFKYSILFKGKIYNRKKKLKNLRLKREDNSKLFFSKKIEEVVWFKRQLLKELLMKKRWWFIHKINENHSKIQQYIKRYGWMRIYGNFKLKHK